jgi:hypothetical protein
MAFRPSQIQHVLCFKAAAPHEALPQRRGSRIQDVTSSRSLWTIFFTLAAAKALGCRVIMYGAASARCAGP